MLQWWFEAKNPSMGSILDKPVNWARGVLAVGSWSDQVLTLAPRVLYRDGLNGGLFKPNVLEAEEGRWMRELRAELARTAGGGLQGTWTGPDGAAGSVTLAPLPRFA
jgi:hypothetical protein